MPWQVTRAELYRLVWSETAVELGKRFGVSDVAIGKACKRNAIPRPGRGYWARVWNGQNPRRTPLPLVPFGSAPVIVIGGDGWLDCTRFDAQPWSPDGPPAAARQESARKRLFRARKLVGDVPVPYTMGRTHPAIEAALRGRQSVEHPGPLDRRRIRLVNAVLLAAEGAGAHIHFLIDGSKLRLRIGSTNVRFKVERVEQRGSDGRLLPSSEIDPLRLEICGTSTAWQDRGENLLEYHLQEIVAELFLAADC